VLRFSRAPRSSPWLAIGRYDHAVPLAEPLNARVPFDESPPGACLADQGRIASCARSSRPLRRRVLALIDAPDLERGGRSPKRSGRAPQEAAAPVRELLSEVAPRKRTWGRATELAQAKAETARAALASPNADPGREKIIGATMHVATSVGLSGRAQGQSRMEVRRTARGAFRRHRSHALQLVVTPGAASGQDAVASGWPPKPMLAASAPRAHRAHRGRRPGDPPVRCAARSKSRPKLKPEMYAASSSGRPKARSAVRVHSALVNRGPVLFVFHRARTGVFEKRKIELMVQDANSASRAGADGR